MAPSFARADPPPLDVHADDVVLDSQQREVDIHGNVRVDAPPFHLTSDALRLRRTGRGVEIDGKGRLAFCPCLGAPLAVAFHDAIVAPPGDLVLWQPRLEIYRVPVFWLPIFWLRSAARVGLLPPDVLYRGTDGLFLGGGVHVPWKKDDLHEGLDLRAGAYLRGGVAIEADLRTPTSRTRVRWDHLGSDGLLLDSRGAFGAAASADGVDAGSTSPPSSELARLRSHPLQEVFAWDVDALRGARAVEATTELEAASRVYDRARVDAQARTSGFTMAVGLRSTSPRGGDVFDLGAYGPVLSLYRGDALGKVGSYDLQVSGGSLRSPDDETLSYARVEGGALLATHLASWGLSLSARGMGDAGTNAERSGHDLAGSARATASLPLVRAFGDRESVDPWRHRLEPSLATAVLTTNGDQLFGAPLGRGLAATQGTAWVAEVGLLSALGRYGHGDGFDASFSAGTVASTAAQAPMGESVSVTGSEGTPTNGTSPSAVARWHAAATAHLLGLGAEGAHLVSLDRPGHENGHALVAHGRVGAEDGLHLSANVAGRAGLDPTAARLLTDAPLEPSSGFLSAQGWTSGGRLVFPFSSSVIVRGGADVDLTQKILLGVRGGLELRDHCQCVTLRATAAHRLGREGVDAWVTLDLVPRAH